MLHRLSFSNVSRSRSGDGSRELRHSLDRSLLSSSIAITVLSSPRPLRPLEVCSLPARGGTVEEEFFVAENPPSAFRFRWVVKRRERRGEFW